MILVVELRVFPKSGTKGTAPLVPLQASFDKLQRAASCHTKASLIRSYPHTAGFSKPSGSRLCV